MNAEAQRIAIAGACGHTNIKIIKTVNDDGAYDVLASDQTANGWTGYDAIDIPDYLNDLNAMHEAENTLREIQGAEYVRQIDRASYYNLFHSVHAAAAKRAECFLRTLNLWTN